MCRCRSKSHRHPLWTGKDLPDHSNDYARCRTREYRRQCRPRERGCGGIMTRYSVELRHRFERVAVVQFIPGMVCDHEGHGGGTWDVEHVSLSLGFFFFKQKTAYEMPK